MRIVLNERMRCPVCKEDRILCKVDGKDDDPAISLSVECTDCGFNKSTFLDSEFFKPLFHLLGYEWFEDEQEHNNVHVWRRGVDGVTPWFDHDWNDKDKEKFQEHKRNYENILKRPYFERKL